MVVALLGLGTVGRAVYEGIVHKEGSLFIQHDIKVKYVLVRNVSNKTIDPHLLTTKFEDIIEDQEVDCVIEMMGANISYDYIKRSLMAKKHVITANKEVIASHFTELEFLAKRKKVQILYEASVGGGIPIITTLNNLSPVNKITRIEGILNGTTNFILTNMHNNKMTFAEALRLAQDKGFAEADPSADLLGLDMVRKIAILSQIAYQSEINIEDVYSYGLVNLTKEAIDVIDLLGYTLKFICYSSLTEDKISIGVEPVVFKRDDFIANVNYEYNVIQYDGNHCGMQSMVGKGAGPLTANSILNDLKLLVNGYKSTYQIINSYQVIGPSEEKCNYFLQLIDKIDPSFIETNLGSIVITKKLTFAEFKSIHAKIHFYAKIRK